MFVQTFPRSEVRRDSQWHRLNIRCGCSLFTGYVITQFKIFYVSNLLEESLDKIALLCFEKFEEPESLFFLITILQEKYKNKGVNAMTILELYNKCFMKISKNPTPVVDLVKQEKAAQPLPAINMSKFYEGYLKQIGELPFEQLTTKLPITTQLVASTVQGNALCHDYIRF